MYGQQWGRRSAQYVRTRPGPSTATLAADPLPKNTVSGSKGEQDRPQFKAMMDAASRREFDVLRAGEKSTRAANRNQLQRSHWRTGVPNRARCPRPILDPCTRGLPSRAAILPAPSAQAGGSLCKRHWSNLLDDGEESRKPWQEEEEIQLISLGDRRKSSTTRRELSGFPRKDFSET